MYEFNSIENITAKCNTDSFNFEKHLNNFLNVDIYLCLLGHFDQNNYLFQLNFQIILVNPSFLTTGKELLACIQHLSPMK